MCINNRKSSLHFIEPKIHYRDTDIPERCQYPEPAESNPRIPKIFFFNQLKYNPPIYA